MSIQNPIFRHSDEYIARKASTPAVELQTQLAAMLIGPTSELNAKKLISALFQTSTPREVADHLVSLGHAYQMTQARRVVDNAILSSCNNQGAMIELQEAAGIMRLAHEACSSFQASDDGKAMIYWGRGTGQDGPDDCRPWCIGVRKTPVG